MDTNSTSPDDLNDIERRLSAWSPTREGLDPDSMLFAAGRASASCGKSRIPWLIVSCALAVAACALATWASVERSERFALLGAIESKSVDGPLNRPRESGNYPITGTANPNGYLVLRRAWEQHSGDWQMNPLTRGELPNSFIAPEPTILRAWQPHGPPEPL